MTPEDFKIFSKRLPERMYLVQDDGLILAVNTAVINFMELPERGIVGKRLHDFLDEEHTKLDEQIKIWSRSGALLPATFSMQHSEGPVKLVIEGCLLSQGEHGNLILLRCESKKKTLGSFAALNNKIQELNVEISARRKAEKTLRTSEEKSRLLLHSTAESIFGMNLEGCCTFANPACVNMLGYDSDKELLGKDMHELIHHTRFDGKKYSEKDNQFSKAYKDNIEVHVDDELLWRRDGTSFSAEYWSYPMVTDEEVVGAVVTFMDITRKSLLSNTLKTIAQSSTAEGDEQFFQSCAMAIYKLLDAKIVMIALFNPKNRESIQTVAYCVKGKFKGNFSYSVIGTPCEQILSTRDTVKLSELQRQYPENLMFADHNVNYFNGEPLFSSQGEMIGVVTVLKRKPIDDSTQSEQLIKLVAKRISMELEQKSINDELMEYREHLEELVENRTAALLSSNRELESYSYSIAHDLRTPLRAIMSFSQIVMEFLKSKSAHDEINDMQRVIDAARTMDHTIAAILELSRITRRELRESQVDLSKIVRNTAEALIEKKSANKISLSVEDKIHTSGDESMLKLLMNCLIGNAIKFTAHRSDAKIIFGQKMLNGTATYFVEDNGVGFDNEFSHKLFRPFQRLHEKAEYEGAGIGLAIVARIVQRHQGEVWAESEINEGTSIYFTLNKPVNLDPALKNINRP